MTSKLIINFETTELYEEFIAWFLDGGGEDTLTSSLEDNSGLRFISRYKRDTHELNLYEYDEERDENGEYSNL